MDRQASWANEDASHVASLSKAVSAAGGNPASPCSYSFNCARVIDRAGLTRLRRPRAAVPRHLALARRRRCLGLCVTSSAGRTDDADIGAVGALGSADARTLAASILANKARRQALSTEMFGFSSIPTATDPALDLAQASSALSAYISCVPRPPSALKNQLLPVRRCQIRLAERHVRPDQARPRQVHRRQGQARRVPPRRQQLRRHGRPALVVRQRDAPGRHRRSRLPLHVRLEDAHGRQHQRWPGRRRSAGLQAHAALRSRPPERLVRRAAAVAR